MLRMTRIAAMSASERVGGPEWVGLRPSLTASFGHSNSTRKTHRVADVAMSQALPITSAPSA